MAKKVEVILSTKDESAKDLETFRARLKNTLTQVETEQKAAAAQFGRTLNQIEKEQQQAADRAGKASKGGLRGLKDSFGEESDIGLLVKTLRGGGAIAGITAGVAAIGQIAKGFGKAEELARAGKQATVEYDDALASMLPIIGQVGIDLDEAFTGRRRMAEANRGVAEYLQGLDKVRISLRNITANTSLGGADLQKAQLQQSTQSQRDDLRDDFRKRTKGAGAGMRERAQEEYNEAIVELNKAEAAQLAEIDRQNYVQRGAAARQFTQQIVTINREGYLSSLTASGQAGKAQVEQVRQQFESQKEAATESARAQLDVEKNLEQRAVIRSRLGSTLKALDAREAQEMQLARESAGRQQRDEARQTNDKVHDLKAQAIQSDLRLSGQGYIAQLNALLESTDQQVTAIERGLADKLVAYAKDPANTGELAAKARANAKAEIDALNLKAAADKRVFADQEKNRAAAKQNQVTSTVNQIELDALKQRAAFGSAEAQLEADKLDIAEQYRQKREAINQTLRTEKDLTAEQRTALERSKAGLSIQESLARFNLEGTSPAAGKPTLTSGRFIEGGLGGAQTRQTNLDDIAKILKDAYTAQNAAAEALKSIAGSPVTFAPVFGA